MSQVLEIVIYKLNDGVAAGQFTAEAAAMERDFAAKQKGFVKRVFGTSGDGQWVDVITWESMEDAHRASEAAMKSPVCAPMFSMLDEHSVKMHHFTIV
jgi:hypothetical protein